MSASPSIANTFTTSSSKPESGQTVRALIVTGAERLNLAGVPSPQLDAEVLLADTLRVSRATLHAHPERFVDTTALRMFQDQIRRRERREPVAYILGRKEFWSLDFEVTSEVLIPRPETELVVEIAARLLRDRRAPQPSVCDLGSGSGCIAITIAKELPDAKIVATDVSSSALEVVQKNAERHGVDGRIEIVLCDLFSALEDRRFDMIIANPPYAEVGELPFLAPEVRFEPTLALIGGADGLQTIRRVIPAAFEHLSSGGGLVMEIGATQGPAVKELAAAAGFTHIRVENDYAGLPRALVARTS